MAPPGGYYLRYRFVKPVISNAMLPISTSPDIRFSKSIIRHYFGIYIYNGTYPPGVKLSSFPVFAKEVGSSPETVRKAISELQKQSQNPVLCLDIPCGVSVFSNNRLAVFVD